MNTGDYAIQALLDKLHDTVRLSVQSSNALSDTIDELRAALADRSQVLFVPDFSLEREGLKLVIDNQFDAD